MLADYLQGLQLFLDPAVLLLIAAAVPVGLLLGVLPGMSGLTALALLLPFVFGMDPMAGLAFLLAAHAVVYTGGALTTILLGIPGAPPNAATLADGYAMSRTGQTGRALGAAFASSGLGGCVGVVALAGLLPFLQPIVLTIGSPETFFLALMGIVYIAVLGQGNLTKGLIAGGLGIFLAMIGEQRITAVPRFWLGFDYLLDGIKIVPLVLGLFAIPEILDLARGRTLAHQANAERPRWAEIRQGMVDVLRHKLLFLRSSVIGVVVGIIPGIGGDTAPFLAYASAKQTSARPERFGSGIVEGVIAPESSNNAKEGGALVTTLGLGIPGSAGMSVLIGGFLILGLEPGPDFLAEHMDIAVGLAIVLAVANLLAVIVMLLLSQFLVRIVEVPGTILAPVLLSLVVLGAYGYQNDPMDVVFVFVFAVLGCVMRALDYSRPALLLGFVLAPLLETYLHISLRAYGLDFLFRPGALFIAALIVAGLLWPLIRQRRNGGAQR
ncbi:tripartite tricarboxylate transporter permease [Pelagibius sp.]|uniref:tripartite tricarboxylate transporter permease n=1 Tax=Pelagibius sp. TaxID=1931238 RepID=UPI00262FF04C|nr:tripartite tricarboxylate transporter permease [Pelagibius sp.]